jgi:putative transposase
MAAVSCHAMSRYRRPVAGQTFFFTVVSYRRRPILCHEPLRAALRLAIETVRSTRPFHVDGWVLLPDHMHCIWTLPLDDADFSRRWSEIKRFVSSSVGRMFNDQGKLTRSRIKRRESSIWQRRFWEHVIRDERDLGRHLDYIHFNPVKHGYAKRAIDWPFSTFARHVQDGIYPPDWGGTADVCDMDLE